VKWGWKRKRRASGGEVGVEREVGGGDSSGGKDRRRTQDRKGRKGEVGNSRWKDVGGEGRRGVWGEAG